MASKALSVNRVVNVGIQMGPISAARADFGTLNIFGTSGVIDANERSRTYTSIEGVAADFGIEAPEYFAATNYFAQSPAPRILMVSCWNAKATPAILKGAVLTKTEANTLRWSTVTNGNFQLSVVGPTGTQQIQATALDFTGQTNLNGVANVIENAIAVPGPFPATLIGGVMSDDDQADFLASMRYSAINWTIIVDGSPVNLNPSLTTAETMADVANALKAADTADALDSIQFASNRFIFTSATTGLTSTLSDVTGGDSFSSTLAALAKVDINGFLSNETGSTAAKKVVLVKWDGDNFTFSGPAGDGYAMGYITAITPTTGTDISTWFKASADTATEAVPGYDAEEPISAVIAAADLSANWYACMFATTTQITEQQHEAVSGYIEILGRPKLYGVTITDTRVLESTYSADYASIAQAAEYNRTITQYSSENPYAIASLFGRMLTVNFNGNMTTITLKFKQEPGITFENLTESQATALTQKNCNVFAFYNNDTAILQEGVVASGAFIDEIHNIDWIANAVQTELYNVLYTSATKVPQTEEGIAILKAVAKGVCEEAVRNGIIGTNLTWTTNGFGTLKYGDILTAGYYLYTVPLVLQSQTDREQRRSPVIQIAIKLAGAIHFVDGIIFVNR